MNKYEPDKHVKIMRELQGLWDKLESELIYSNRFFPNSSDILDKLESIFKKRIYTIGGNDIRYFRAREFILDKIEKSQLLTVIESCLKWDQSSTIIERLINLYFDGNVPESEWGYSKDRSGKPPSENAGLNRASPKYISYLYLASDVDTALAETRAQIGQLFSVAQYEVEKEIKLIDLRLSTAKLEQMGEGDFFLLFRANQAFSTPAHSTDKDYIMSQYIAEFIKASGYDGIVFNSSRNKRGTNYTLFDDSVCNFICSEIHKVDNISITSAKLLPPSQRKRSRVNFTCKKYSIISIRLVTHYP